VTTIEDLHGMYEAEARDTAGSRVGWMTIRVSPFQGPRRIYDADLPESVQEPLAAAAVLLVNSDLSSMRAHALDVHLGN
jgi:hypothetical protein